MNNAGCPTDSMIFRHAAEVAHANDRMVSLTLSDSFCVERHRDEAVPP